VKNEERKICPGARETSLVLLYTCLLFIEFALLNDAIHSYLDLRYNLHLHFLAFLVMENTEAH